MWNDGDREFAGSQNGWIKRLGLFILILGLFPIIALKYWDEVEILGKVIMVLIVISYVIYHVKSLIKSTFKPKK